MNYPDTFKKTFPKKKLNDIDEYYYDQAYRVVKIYDRRISSFLLPMGIKKIDSWFARQIQMEKSKFSRKQLERLIRRNPHLHNVIKTDLLSNLNRKYGIK